MINSSPDISVVIPARNEVTALGSLVEEIEVALAGEVFEIIVVDDGSTDGSSQLLAQLAARHARLCFLRNETSIGQSASIRRGVRYARASLIVTLDGDGQNPPDQVPKVLAPFFLPGSARLGLVQGQRAQRMDTVDKRIGSRVANTIRGALLHDGVRDSGCGLKAFRRAAYLDLPWFDHIHRFMPAMMLREGWDVQTVTVTHRERQGGRSAYGNLSRALVGVVDLLGAVWLMRRAQPIRHGECDPAEARETPEAALPESRQGMAAR